MQWQVELPPNMIWEPLGIRLLAQAKSKKNIEGVLSVSLEIFDQRCMYTLRAGAFYQFAPPYPYSPLPKKHFRTPVTVFLRIVAEAPAAACSVIRLFVERHNGLYRPLQVGQCFTMEGLLWLEKKIVEKCLTPWERGVVLSIDFKRSVVAYKFMPGAHFLAGALAVRGMFAKYGCRAEGAMKIVLGFLGVKPFEILQDVSQVLRSALAGIEHVRTMLPHSPDSQSLMNLKQSCDAVEMEIGVVICPVGRLSKPSITLVGPQRACFDAHAMICGNFPLVIRQQSSSLHVARIDVQRIGYTTRLILDTFTDGRSLMEMIERLLNDKDYYRQIPLMRVVYHDGLYWSKDNRRLFVFKHCCLGEIEVEMQVSDEDFVSSNPNDIQVAGTYQERYRTKIILSQRFDCIALPRSPFWSHGVTKYLSDADQLEHERRVAAMPGRHTQQPSSCWSRAWHEHGCWNEGEWSWWHDGWDNGDAWSWSCWDTGVAGSKWGCSDGRHEQPDVCWATGWHERGCWNNGEWSWWSGGWYHSGGLSWSGLDMGPAIEVGASTDVPALVAEEDWPPSLSTQEREPPAQIQPEEAGHICDHLWARVFRGVARPHHPLGIQPSAADAGERVADLVHRPSCEGPWRRGAACLGAWCKGLRGRLGRREIGRIVHSSRGSVVRLASLRVQQGSGAVVRGPQHPPIQYQEIEAWCWRASCP